MNLRTTGKYRVLFTILMVTVLLFTSLGNFERTVYAQDNPPDTSPLEPTLSEEPTLEPTLTEEPILTAEPTLEPTSTQSGDIRGGTNILSSISFGVTIQGSILTPGEADAYTFTANKGDKVLVKISKSSGDFWPRIRVYGLGGIQQCEASGTTTAEIASCPLPDNATYTILVSDNGMTQTGDYYLYLQRLNNPGSPVAIAFGQTRSGSLISPSEMDTYSFTANAGDKVLVKMSKLAGNLWPRIRVYSPLGIQLCEQYGTTTAEIASCTLPSAGKYTILVGDFHGTDTGDYYLYTQRLNSPGSPVPIAFGQTRPGSINTPAEMDTYSFTANAGDKVLVRLSNSSGNLWPRIKVYSPVGIQLCEAYGTTTTEIASCTLPTAGIYSILANDYHGTDTGDYYLYLQRLNSPGSPVPIIFGQARSGSLISPAKMATYTFTASAGDKVLVRMSNSSGNLWPRIRVYSPGGIQLCEAYGTTTAEIASCSLPSSGTYSILANDYHGTDTGNYYLYLQRLNSPGSPVSIAFGQTHSGSIISPTEMDTYTFTASANDRVLVRMSKSSGNLWPEIRVYSPGGTQLCEEASPTTAEIASCTLPSTGRYTVLAADGFDGTLTGGYYLYMQRLNAPGSPASIPFAETLTGSIISPAEMDTYTFTAGTGAKVLVRMSKLSGDLWPEIRVYSPGGIQLCEASSSTTANIASCTLPNTGKYTILADDGFDGTFTGVYSLYVQLLNRPGAFNKSSPANGSSNQLPNPTLVWSASSSSTSYDYCYDTTNDNACASWKSNGTATSKTLSGLSFNTTYYWQVRAKNVLGTTYANSGTWWSFTTKPLITKQFSSTGANDGWILESTETSGVGGTLAATAATFNLGDDAAKKQYRGVLSFYTGTSLPDNAIITSVTLKIKKSAVIGGGDPVTIFQGFIVDIKKGFFGTLAALQASDFQEAAGNTYGPFTPTPVSELYSINLTSAKGYINKVSASSGLTQIRLRFKLDDNNDAVANYIRFFSGDSATYKPFLIITYYVP